MIITITNQAIIYKNNVKYSGDINLQITIYLRPNNINPNPRIIQNENEKAVLRMMGLPKRFEIMPYAAGQYKNDSLEPSGGVDFEYDISSNLIFNATLLPDFAQIEADPYEFNLSYEEGEELYFPEKRPFFLEGGIILNTPFRLFYTRRMNEILAGAKLYGKIKSTELLALDVQTKDTEENFSVIRLKQELFGTATLGAIVTHKQHKDSVSQAASIDLNLPVYGPFRFTSQFALTNNTGISAFILALTSSIHPGKCSKLPAFVRSKTRIVPSDPL